MKIILQKQVEKLGAPGDSVEVADGYARNYLLPRGLAIKASKGAVKHSDSLRRAHDQRVAKGRAEAEALAARLTASPLVVTARAGDEGKLFGSITAADLAEEIERSSGVSVDRRDVELPEPIRSIGVHDVRVRLNPDVDVALSVEVRSS
ncbi:MAG: 50S ribosomal protein L9 [Actinomycetota bacterium]